jgi:Putative peptidoglycan binding domain
VTLELGRRELWLGMQAADVGMLHDALRRLGAAISFNEVEGKEFGASTRDAVIQYQREHALEPTGVVDERTAAALNGDVAELDARGRGYLVYGRVVGGNGPLTVQALDRDLRSEERLGEVVTRDGAYEIGFTAEQFSRAEKARADIVVRVANAAGLPVGESPIHYNGPPVARIDVVIGDGALRPSEYETLLAEITPLLQGLAVASLVEDEAHQDVTFLAGETGIDPFRIALLVASHKLSERTEIQAEVFYGLFREGLPTRLSALVAQRADVLTRALVRAAEQSIVPAAIGAEAGAYVERLKLLIARLALEGRAGEGEASPSEVLALALPDGELQQDFLDAYIRNSGGIEVFWARLRDRPGYAERVDDLQFVLHLAELTGNHLQLVRELARMRQGGEFTALADLARFDEDDWAEILNRDDGGERIGVPAGVPGASDDAKFQTYARALANRVEDAFPREYVRHRLESDEALPWRENLRAFLDANPDFDLRITRLDPYLAEHPEALATVPDAAAAQQQIKALQRVYRLTRRYRQASALLKAGITSAHAITRMGFNVFRETVGPAF